MGFGILHRIFVGVGPLVNIRNLGNSDNNTQYPVENDSESEWFCSTVVTICNVMFTN